MGALIPAQLALLLLAQAGTHAPTYSVSGRVTFDDGEPLAGAEVYASPNGGTPAGDTVLTDSDGRFSITDLPKGAYFLNATREDIGSAFLGHPPSL